MRIVIAGLPGAGKSFFARRLAREQGYHHIEADTIYWDGGGKALELSEFRKSVEAITQRSDWIYEGHASKVDDLLVARADVWIELTTPPPICLARMLRREMASLLRGPDRASHARRLWFNFTNWRTLVRRQEEIIDRVRALGSFTSLDVSSDTLKLKLKVMARPKAVQAISEILFRSTDFFGS